MNTTGIDVEETKRALLINALLYAANFGRVRMCKYLLRLIKPEKLDFSIIAKAIDNRKHKIVRLFLPYIDIDERSEANLGAVLVESNSKCVKEILPFVANTRNIDYILRFAARRGDKKLFKLAMKRLDEVLGKGEKQ